MAHHKRALDIIIANILLYRVWLTYIELTVGSRAFNTQYRTHV